MNRSRRFIAAAAILTLLCGCSRTQQDWQTAQQAATPRAYGVFVERHPDSELAGVARQRIEQLAEQAAWQQATRANTAAAYQGYLAKYPDGSWSQDARIRMESKSLAARAPQGNGAIAPVVAKPVAAPAWPGSGGAAGVARTAGPPSAAHATAAPAAVDRSAASLRGGGGLSAVQLGAFSSAGNARTAWSQLSSTFHAELGGLSPQVVPVSLSGRRLYRLQARVADAAVARRLCRQLTQHSQGCLPVP